MLLLENAPRLDLDQAASLTEELYGIRATITLLPSERDQNFLLTTEAGEKFVLKIANALEERALLEAQQQVMTHLCRYVSICPRVIPTRSGAFLAESQSATGAHHFVRLVTYLPGTPLACVRHSSGLLRDLGRRIGQMDRALATFDHPAFHRDFHWDLAHGLRVVDEYRSLIADEALREMIGQLAADFRRDVRPLLPALRRSVIHNDANDYNVLVATHRDTDTRLEGVTGLIDFGDMVYSYTVGDLAVAIAYAILDKPDPLASAALLVEAYHGEYPLTEAEIAAVFSMASLRLSMSVCLAAHQQRQRPANDYLAISQDSIQRTLPKLAEITPDSAEKVFRDACGLSERSRTGAPTKAETLAARRRVLGPNLGLAYKEPLKIVRGWMQYLYDEKGRRYLDAYNNVPHVGHCHPRVVKAGQEQMAALNTNTRYLHDHINHYAENLCATMPAPLSVCYFVNSGSEANELALRLARTHTGQRDLIALEHAYHGNTTALIDISHFKHSGPGGCGAPPWVHIAPLADTYRGLYRNGPEGGQKYARHVMQITERLRANGTGLAGFIAETFPSVAGQIVFPEGYLAAVYACIRDAGGVCIADEVQTGLGRIGTHLWSFAAQGVVPDIVVLGKPIGNGHPLGAVITTPEIAASFDNGMEFFSTFGGNTVSCAIGLAVLATVFEEDLQAHALAVGERLLEGLRGLMNRHAIIGDVRGSGFFLGVELVRNRETLEPAAEEASIVVNRLCAQGILLDVDGPYHNVLKIRPPMPFSETDADLLITSLDRVLAEKFGVLRGKH